MARFDPDLLLLEFGPGMLWCSEQVRALAPGRCPSVNSKFRNLGIVLVLVVVLVLGELASASQAQIYRTAGKVYEPIARTHIHTPDRTI
jgi:hypothetical protein